MNHRIRPIVPAALAASAGLVVSLPALAGPPSLELLLQHGDVPTGTPSTPAGLMVTAIRGTSGPTRDRFAAMIELDEQPAPVIHARPLSAVWGVHPSPAPDGTRQILVCEQAPTGALDLDQVRFEDAFGYTAQGIVSYSALVSVGGCSPLSRGRGLLDSVWVGSTLLALDGISPPDAVAPGLAEYAYVSRPGLTGGGQAYWLAGTRAPATALPGRHVLYTETAGGPVLPWISTGLAAAGSTVQSLGASAVSTLGTFALCTAGLANGDQVLLRGEWDGPDPLVYPVDLGGFIVGKNRLLMAIGKEPGEKWKRLLHVGAGENADPGMPHHWFIVAETATTSGSCHHLRTPAADGCAIRRVFGGVLQQPASPATERRYDS